MGGLRFTDNAAGEEVMALGLPAGRLALAGLGMALAWGAGHSPAPVGLRLLTAGVAAALTVALCWGRVHQCSLAGWTWIGAKFAARRMLRSCLPSNAWLWAEEPAQLPDTRHPKASPSPVPRSASGLSRPA